MGLRVYRTLCSLPQGCYKINHQHFRVHHGQITSSAELVPVVDKLRKSTKDRVQLLRVSKA